VRAVLAVSTGLARALFDSGMYGIGWFNTYRGQEFEAIEARLREWAEETAESAKNHGWALAVVTVIARDDCVSHTGRLGGPAKVDQPGETEPMATSACFGSTIL